LQEDYFAMIKFLSLSIRTQLLLIVLIAALPAAGIIIYSGFEQRASAVKEARAEMQRLAAIIASEQRSRAASAEQLLKILAQLPEVKKHHPSRVDPLLVDLLKLHTQYSNIVITDLSGSVWASAVPANNVNVSDRRHFKNALATGQLSSGEYIVSRFTNKFVLTLAYPYSDERGTIAGVIVLGFDLDYYKHLIDSSDTEGRKGYLLLDHKGVILARPVHPELFVGKQYDEEQFRKMQQGPDEATGLMEKGLDGRKRYFAYSKQRLAGEKDPYLYIRTSIPVETVLSEANRHLFANLGVFTLFFLMALLLAWFIGKRSILNRVALLEAASHRMAGGDLQVRVADRVKGGELGSLGQTFDHMALQLKEREQEKIKLIDDLQQALTTIKTLQGILPICSSCKKIRNDEGQWTQLESYICEHSQAEFSHGLCPDCAKTLYPKYYNKGDEK
jgi:HAMP domain-containing protein